MPDANVLLELQDLSCERDDRTLFSGLNARFCSGEVWRIEGANGTGKSTLLRAICGLFSDIDGVIVFRNERIDKQRIVFNQNKLFIGHKTGVKPALTAQENLAWLAGQVGRSSVQELRSALAQVGLRGFEDVPAFALSAGQQRRIALARLYVEKVPLWILDEPFTAIDAQGVAQLELLLSSHVAAGGTVILTTHHTLKIPNVRVSCLKLGVDASAGDNGVN